MSLCESIEAEPLGASSLRNSLDFKISDVGYDFDYIIFIKEISPSIGI